MNKRLSELSRQYAALLRDYLVAEQERILQQAYELGREAIALDLGVFCIAGIHHQSLATCLFPLVSPVEATRRLNAAQSFFLEVLSPFEARHRGFLEANTALQRRNAELDTLNLNLRDLSTQILHVQEEERKRISRELHDEVGQALTASLMNLSVLEREGSLNMVRFQRIIDDTQWLLQQTMETVHRFARELRPAMLDELGLLPTLRSYVKGFAQRTGIEAKLRACSDAENLNGDEKTVLFRIAQESLTNVAKHAHASRVSVILRKTTYTIQMEVKDDGKAFQTDQGPSRTGQKRLGLLGMQERVRLVHGCFAVESALGKGTTVRVEIPVGAGLLPAIERSNVSTRD